MLAPSKPALKKTCRAPSMIWRRFAPPSLAAPPSRSKASDSMSEPYVLRLVALTEPFGSIFVAIRSQLR
ncbi:MAG: hypothetical protein WAN05_24785, partial [Roseiarcus sp.]